MELDKNKDEQSTCNNVQDKQGFNRHFIAPLKDTNHLFTKAAEESFRKPFIKRRLTLVCLSSYLYFK